MLAEGDPLRAAEGAGLDDEDLLARGVDADAESGKVAIPEDGILAIDGEGVDGTFGQGSVLALRHVGPPGKAFFAGRRAEFGFRAP